MKLSEIVSKIECEVINFKKDIEIASICFDSGKAKENSLFFCISGEHANGHDFAENAVENGAKALMVTKKLSLDVAQILVSNDRKVMAEISAIFFENPQKRMKMIGITGTNGKTTSTYMLKAILEASGKKVGLVGTIVNIIGNEKTDALHTTPEAPELFCLLRRMADEGCEWVVMEVSSHSLELYRVFGIKFDVAGFTNLTQDHLDYHLSMENYRNAKRKLFENSIAAITNADDSAGAKIAEGLGIDVCTYAVENKADFMAKDIEMLSDSVSFSLNGIKFNIPIPGIFTVYNALLSIAVANALGESLKDIAAALKNMGNVPGRFEVISANTDFTVIMDYSHTPDSLENALNTINKFKKARVICVFGCGGDRDAAKRPIMGEISGRLADYSVVTSDNPRTEPPMEIINQISAGINKTEYTVIENRKDAIEFALKIAKKDDIILLAGKGHETYQEINHIKHPFDEKEITGELIKKLKS